MSIEILKETKLAAIVIKVQKATALNGEASIFAEKLVETWRKFPTTTKQVINDPSTKRSAKSLAIYKAIQKLSTYSQKVRFDSELICVKWGCVLF